MDSIEIKGRKFVFQVPTAWGGCAIIDALTTYTVPFGANAIMGIQSTKQPMPLPQLEAFMKLCLKNCFEIKQSDTGIQSKIQVVDEEGEIGIIGNSSPLFVQIVTQFLLFFVEYWKAEIGFNSSPDLPDTSSPSPLT
jgi:hypothetical protein